MLVLQNLGLAGAFGVAAFAFGLLATRRHRVDWPRLRVAALTLTVIQVVFIVAFRKRLEGWMIAHTPSEAWILAANGLNALVETLAKLWLVISLLKPTDRGYRVLAYWIGLVYGCGEAILLATWSSFPGFAALFGGSALAVGLGGPFTLERMVTANSHALLTLVIALARVRRWGWICVALAAIVHFSVDGVVLASRGLFRAWGLPALQASWYFWFLGAQITLAAAFAYLVSRFWPAVAWRPANLGRPDPVKLTRRLGAYLVGSRRRLVLLTFLFLLMLPLALLEPFVLKYLLDEVLVRSDKLLLMRFGAVILGMMVLKTVLDFTGNAFAIDLARRLHLQIKLDYLRNLLHKPMTLHEGTPRGVLVFSFFSDTNRLGEYISLGVVNLALHGLLFVVMVSAAFWLGPAMTVIALGLLPVQAFLLVKAARRVERLQITMKQQDERLTSQVEDMLQGIATVKGFGIEELLLNRWRLHFATRLGTDFRSLLLQKGASLAAADLQGYASLAVMLWGIWQVLDGSLTLGRLMAFLLVFGRMLVPFNYLVGTILSLRETWVSAMRFYAFRDLPDEEAARATAAEGSRRSSIAAPIRRICVDEPAVVFPSGRRLQFPGRLTFVRGTSYAWVGHTGSGKSTLAKVICGYIPHHQGHILLDDVPLEAVPLREVRKRAVYLPSDSFWLEIPLRENFEVVRRTPARPGHLEQLLALTEADGIIDTLPLKLQTPVQAAGRLFSQGELQKLALARALYAEPDVLILDEAVAHLPAPDSDRILQRLLTDYRDLLLVSICHRPDQARHFDQLVEFPALRLLQVSPARPEVSR